MYMLLSCHDHGNCELCDFIEDTLKSLTWRLQFLLDEGTDVYWEETHQPFIQETKNFLRDLKLNG